jgi:hypothetical protein
MGPELLDHVERQLLDDLNHYGIATDGLRIDWLDPVQEGHRTDYLNGTLESMSDVIVRDGRGEPVLEGWIDFVHGAPDGPLFVFWLFLRRRDAEALKDDPNLPGHVWSRLPERSREVCATEGG